MTLYDKLASLKGRANQSAWAVRIASELGYAAGVSTAQGHQYDALIEKTADYVLDAMTQDGGVITKATAQTAEEMLQPLAADAKSYRVHCVSHAHIDMNWQWGFQETASVTVDTFRTVLDLMKEYPTLTFAQSQASTYEIVEEFSPEMLDEIRQRIHEGRWEVSASTWVELDKNMPNGESMARHLLYTRRYLSRLLDIPAESLNLDFEPDTFGHNITVPEICQRGGVKYYYHCRGNGEADNAYRWRARSGAEVLVWREPKWYNYTIDPSMFDDVPQLCEKMGMRDYLSVYGVGDHGGGPTRRDVDRLITLNSWPIMPTIMFSTYARFFAELEKVRDTLPVQEGEKNFVFTGCYTSQSRIKMANRIGEDRMYESEFLGTAAHVLAGGPRYNQSFEKAWRGLLFNHFHDILPGSGVIDTREYAMGQFQRSMAAIDTNANNAMRHLAEVIDTSSISGLGLDGDSISAGAGIGYMTNQDSHYCLPRAERGVGKKRVFHFFNPTCYDFDGVSDLTVWDWNYDVARAQIAAADGNLTPFKLIMNGAHYWGHHLKQLAVRIRVPAMGYATYTLDVRGIEGNNITPLVYERTDRFTDDDLVMENSRLRAVFDHATMQLISLVDKATGTDVVALPSANFRLITENTIHHMTSWRVGEYMTVQNLNETVNVHLNLAETSLGGVRQWIKYDLPFGQRSHLTVGIRLDENSSMLEFDLRVDFHEVGSPAGIPQLNFSFPVGYGVANYRYDVPFGTIDRAPIAHDVPANSFAAAIPAQGESDRTVMVVTDSKYGFRGVNNEISVDLIRASYDPDPYPEYGKHTIRLGVGVAEGTANKSLYRLAAAFVHPIAACATRGGKGTLPLNGQFIRVEGDVNITCVKTAEDTDGVIIRLFGTEGEATDCILTFAKPLAAAAETDINEHTLGALPFEGNTLTVHVEPFTVKTLLLRF